MSIKMLSCMISLLCIVTGILGDCENIRILNKKLQYTNRLEYMKYNFPINYTIRVHREEVLRASKVTRLMQRYNATESDLQKLWWFTSNNIVKRIRDVLPKKHPSYNYTTDLQNIMEETMNTTEDDVLDTWIPGGIVHDIVSRLRSPEEKRPLKSVKPKTLLDNCFKVMDMLFSAICKLH